jgi:hypothetical protein
MAETRDTSHPVTPPQTERSYERAIPEAEAGMGRLENNESTPTERPDELPGTVRNAHNPNPRDQEEGHQILRNQQRARQTGDSDIAIRKPDEPIMPQPDHSMHEEEPLGWDQRPQEATPDERRKHPRPDGIGAIEEPPGGANRK